MATTSDYTETKNLIRKHRKKLRQIEHLERLNRSLSPDESIKVESKHEVRDLLNTLLANFEEDCATEIEENKKDETQNFISGDKCKDNSSSQELNGFEKVSQKEKEANSTASLENGNSKDSCEQLLQNRGSDEGIVRSLSDVKLKVQSHTAASGDNTPGKEKKKKSSKQYLASSQFKVRCLEGHSDLITTVVLHKDTIVTASQDTTVKTWDLLTGAQKKNFGGHKNSVTCLVVLDVADAHKSVPEMMKNDEPVVVSGSFDCSLKVWSLESGQLLKSIYTYNPVSEISYISECALLVLGSDTGKLELWDLDKGEQRYSLHAYDASITGIKVADRQLQTSASDGTIKVYSMTDDIHLSCVFESENIQSISGGYLTPRHIRSLEVCEKGILIGDDAKNIKILDWKKNEAIKVPNHHSDYSSTDAIKCHGDFVIASSYDLDSGLGYLNVRCSRTLDYLTTFDDKDTERILCLDFSHLSSKGNLIIVSGGMELKVWEVLRQPAKTNSEGVFHAEFRRDLTKTAVNSEDEDEDDDNDDEEDDMNESASCSKSLGFEQETQGSWMSWCTVI